jgi:hypothetical protein
MLSKVFTVIMAAAICILCQGYVSKPAGYGGRHSKATATQSHERMEKEERVIDLPSRSPSIREKTARHDIQTRAQRICFDVARCCEAQAAAVPHVVSTTSNCRGRVDAVIRLWVVVVNRFE